MTVYALISHVWRLWTPLLLTTIWVWPIWHYIKNRPIYTKVYNSYYVTLLRCYMVTLKNVTIIANANVITMSRCTHPRILPLRPVFKQDIQLQQTKSSWSNTKPKLCYTTAATVPKERWPEDSYKYGSQHTKNFWQRLL